MIELFTETFVKITLWSSDLILHFNNRKRSVPPGAQEYAAIQTTFMYLVSLISCEEAVLVA